MELQALQVHGINQSAMSKLQASPYASSMPGKHLNASRSFAGGGRPAKHILSGLLVLTLLLCGCARAYVITLTNGTRITAKGKPKFQNGSYVFKDAQGQPAQVSAGRVREIAPASMATQEGSQFMK